MEVLEGKQGLKTTTEALSQVIDLIKALTPEVLQDLTIDTATELINVMRRSIYVIEEIGQDIMNIAILNDLDKAGAAAAVTNVVTLPSSAEMIPVAKRKYTKQQVVGHAIGFKR
jgi:hypothetical protein